MFPANASDNDNSDMQNKIEANACLLLPPADNGKPNIGVAGAFAGMVNGKLYVAGGANFPGGFPWTGAEKVWHRTLYVYDFDKAQWSQYPGFLPEPAAYGVSVTTPDGIIVIGGSNAGGNRADVRLITEREGKPAIINDALPQLPFPWSNGAGALVGSKIFIAGGIRGNNGEAASDTFLMLDLDNSGEGWQQLPSWPGETVGFSVAAACGGKFYLFGGRDFGPGRPTEIKPYGYAYDTVSGAWQQLPGEFPVMAGSAATVGDEIWIFGGVEEILPTDPSHPGFPKKIRRYNPAANTLEAVGETTVPVAVTTTAVKRTDRDIILASGEERPGVRTPLLLQIHVR